LSSSARKSARLDSLRYRPGHRDQVFTHHPQAVIKLESSHPRLGYY
jgi:hypothetical protein